MADKNDTPPFQIHPIDIMGAMQRWCRELDGALERGVHPSAMNDMILHIYALNEQLIRMVPATEAQQKAAPN